MTAKENRSKTLLHCIQRQLSHFVVESTALILQFCSTRLKRKTMRKITDRPQAYGLFLFSVVMKA